MPVMQQVPADSPLMKAWEAYRETEDYKNSWNWATRQHGLENGPNGDRTRATDVQRGEWVKGALWASFVQGFQMALSERHAAFVEANEVCRSAYQIAARGGAETNWPAFKARLDEALKRQHELMYPKAPEYAADHKM